MAEHGMELIIALVIRLLPAITVGLVLLKLIPRRESFARCFIHIGIFAVVRDTFTPLGLWKIETHELFYIRLPNDSMEILLLSLSSCFIVFGSVWFEPELAKNIIWSRKDTFSDIFAGILGALLIAFPVIGIVGGTSPPGSPLVAVSSFELLLFSMTGNLYEELLFRGFMQTYLSKCEDVGIDKAAWISGVTFAFCHCSLATATTDTGAPLLLFCLFEGVIAAKLYQMHGLVSATVAHGGAIFLVSGGLF